MVIFNCVRNSIVLKIVKKEEKLKNVNSNAMKIEVWKKALIKKFILNTPIHS